MKVAITGASGFLGRRISGALTAASHSVVSIGRGPQNDVVWDPKAGRIDPAPLEGVDAVIHLAGESIGGDRLLGPQWDDSKKQAIMQSRIDGTSLIAATLAQLSTPPSVLVSASATGYYGTRGDEVLTEEAGPGDNFFASVCQAWEDATAPAAEAGVRVVTTRTGIVVSDEAEAFRRLLFPFRVGAGGPLGSGRQWWPLVALTDVIRVTIAAVESESWAGPINVVAPEPMRQRDFAKALGSHISRPSFVPAPGFALKMLLGGDFVENVLLPSIRAVPAFLTEAGFEFAHPTVQSMLEGELSG